MNKQFSFLKLRLYLFDVFHYVFANKIFIINVNCWSKKNLIEFDKTPFVARFDKKISHFIVLIRN